MIGALGTVTKGFLKNLEDLEVGGRVEIIQTTVLPSRPESWDESWRLEETCCHSNSSVKPTVNADVKNSKRVYNNNINNNNNNHVVLVAWISLTLSRHFSLSFIASCRSSGQHPVSSHSCWMYVRAGRPAVARPCVGVHKSTSLMSSSLLLQRCPTCLVRLTWIVFVIWGRLPYSWCLAARTCSGLLAAFLCNCRLASSPAVLLESM